MTTGPDLPGPLVHCDRCAAVCRHRGPRNPDARIMRRAALPKGWCANCAMTHWLKTIEPLPTILAHQGPGVLLLPAIQDQVTRVLDAAQADVDPSEIDWQTVVNQWDLCGADTWNAIEPRTAFNDITDEPGGAA